MSKPPLLCCHLQVDATFCQREADYSRGIEGKPGFAAYCEEHLPPRWREGIERARRERREREQAGCTCPHDGATDERIGAALGCPVHNTEAWSYYW